MRAFSRLSMISDYILRRPRLCDVNGPAEAIGKGRCQHPRAARWARARVQLSRFCTLHQPPRYPRNEPRLKRVIESSSSGVEVVQGAPSCTTSLFQRSLYEARFWCRRRGGYRCIGSAQLRVRVDDLPRSVFDLPFQSLLFVLNLLLILINIIQRPLPGVI